VKTRVHLALPDGISFQGTNTVQLLKVSNGLKQAERDWNDLQDRLIRSYDPELKRRQTEHCINFKITIECIFIISFHVDDYIVGHNNDSCMKVLFEHYKKHVEIKISNKCEFILQMSLQWEDGKVYLSQNRQIERLFD